MSTRAKRFEAADGSPAASTATLVGAAAAGDERAFEALVRRFQDLALATAYAWLKDPAAAEDAAQDAFLEVHRNLDRIREPAAFPGLLRSVVRKHCDRRTRSRREMPALPGTEPGDAAPSAEASMSVLEDRLRVRAAVEDLPEPERMVVALHYLGGLGQPEAAEWLGLPLSTVKKRLHTARGRIRASMERMMDETFEAMRPSRGTRFSDTIRLFLAIREGDVATVGELLASDPGLCEAEERWDREITHAHQLPAPNGGTPLVRAAEYGRVDVIDLLVDHGADPSRACPCAGAESALWAAVANGRTDAARRLLELGADPDHASFAGHGPLHVAALRGFDEMVDLLLAAGADPARRDDHGRTPGDWAREKGRAALAGRLAGAPRADGESPAGGEVAAPAIGTGIKALDLLAPVLPGSLVQTRFDEGVGAVVLLGELSARWAAREGLEAGAPVLWVGWEQHPWDRDEMEHGIAELGLDGSVELVWSPACDDEPTRQATLERAAARARAVADAGASPLVVVWARPGRWTEIEAGLAGLAEPARGAPVTTVVAERYGDPSADEGPLRTPFDARIAFDPGLAALRHFPAVHPLRSRPPGRLLSPRHAALLERVRTLFQAHRALAPDCGDGDPPAQSDDERQAIARARRLQAYLTQGFWVAESFSGLPGHAQGLESTLADVEAILDGALDDTELARVAYRGSLAEIRG